MGARMTVLISELAVDSRHWFLLSSVNLEANHPARDPNCARSSPNCACSSRPRRTLKKVEEWRAARLAGVAVEGATDLRPGAPPPTSACELRRRPPPGSPAADLRLRAAPSTSAREPRRRPPPASRAADLRPGAAPPTSACEPRRQPAPGSRAADPRPRAAASAAAVWGGAARRPLHSPAARLVARPAQARLSSVCRMNSAPDCPYELELTNTFSLDIVVQGFVLKEPTGRKSYVKGKTIRWNVNSDNFTMDVLMDGLSSELRVGRDQSITVWYFNMIMAQDVKLTQSDDFHLMFDMYRAERRLALVVVVVDNSCSETLDPMLDNADYVPEATIPDNDVLLLGLQGCPLTPSKNGASYSTSPLKQSAQVVPSTSTIETDPFDMFVKLCSLLLLF
ncbi:uncharacterized protein [Lolium perenne]|uniref:uncharacterized protein n=1 Tax=Lolium perenne TaxID=4522 RepID=UPI0021F5E28B|nr:uncharacterized protein LOC127303877 [Lolium perenne]